MEGSGLNPWRIGFCIMGVMILITWEMGKLISTDLIFLFQSQKVSYLKKNNELGSLKSHHKGKAKRDLIGLSPRGLAKR